MLLLGSIQKGLKKCQDLQILNQKSLNCMIPQWTTKKTPECYVIYDNEQCYPTYLIRYRDLKWNDNQSTTSNMINRRTSPHPFYHLVEYWGYPLMQYPNYARRRGRAYAFPVSSQPPLISHFHLVHHYPLDTFH